MVHVSPEVLAHALASCEEIDEVAEFFKVFAEAVVTNWAFEVVVGEQDPDDYWLASLANELHPFAHQFFMHFGKVLAETIKPGTTLAATGPVVSNGLESCPWCSGVPEAPEEEADGTWWGSHSCQDGDLAISLGAHSEEEWLAKWNARAGSSDE